MEVTCKKCGNQNPLGAIFCRACGEKIEMEDFTPKVTSGSKRKMSAFVVRRLISLVLSVVLLGFIAALFLKPSVPTYDVEVAEKDIVNKQKIFFNRLNKNPRYMKATKLEISAAEAGAIITKDFQDMIADPANNIDPEKATILPKEMIFKVVDNSRFKMILVSTLNMGMKIDLYSTLVMKVEALEEGGVDIVVDGAGQGWVGLPEFARASVVANFKRLIAEGDKPEEMMKEIDSVELSETDGTILFLFKKPARKARR